MSDSMTSELNIRLADWESPDDGNTVVSLLDAFAHDPMGGGAPLSTYVKNNLPDAMAATPGAFSVIGFQSGQAVALANCFTALSTFSCKPVINIHDLVVLSHVRGGGVGQQMLGFIQEHGVQVGACKITLEVLEGNTRARQSYERFGFESYTLDDTTGHALFLYKTI